MNSQTTPNGCLLIFRGTDWYKGLSPEQMQQVADQWMVWFKGLTDEGIAKAGDPLESTGVVVSGAGGKVVDDGPFMESKETIGGYFLLKVDTLEEAVKIAQQCPGLPYGIRVEVRAIAGECAMISEAKQTAQLTHA